MQQVVDRARIPLNDDDKVRHADPELLGYANDAVLILRQQRPDIFFGQFEALPGAALIGDPMPVQDEYFVALADYVTARAETPDDESVDQGRAQLFFALFAQQEDAQG